MRVWDVSPLRFGAGVWGGTTSASDSTSDASSSGSTSLASASTPLISPSRSSRFISAIDTSSGSLSSIFCSGSSANWERSGISASPADAEGITGLSKSERSGTPVEDDSALSFGAAPFLPVPMISEKSSASDELNAGIVDSELSGIPRTKSSESSTSRTVFGIGIMIGFSPRDARACISLPSARISELNFFSWLNPGIIHPIYCIAKTPVFTSICPAYSLLGLISSFLKLEIFHPFRSPTEWRVSKVNKMMRRRGSGCVPFRALGLRKPTLEARPRLSGRVLAESIALFRNTFETRLSTYISFTK